jgi:hypothetical protein
LKLCSALSYQMIERPVQRANAARKPPATIAPVGIRATGQSRTATATTIPQRAMMAIVCLLVSA